MNWKYLQSFQEDSMPNILNITNGDSAVNIMREARIEGDFLPWHDLLHEGAVPAGLSLEALSEVRTEYLASNGYGSLADIQQSFNERDSMMRNLEQYDKIVLWFEHDLYDQLQLLQILNFLYQNPVSCECTIICTDNYLGMCTASEMLALKSYEEKLTEEHLKLGSECWEAFTSSSPLDWQGVLEKDTSVLPFLEGAVLRLLEEYPSKRNGLSRTASEALKIIAKEQECRPGRVFGLYIETEERKFHGDSSFWNILETMLESNPPLLTLNMPLRPINPEQCLKMTELGREVLEGKKNFLDYSTIDFWIGGVHITKNTLWCWDGKEIINRGLLKQEKVCQTSKK